MNKKQKRDAFAAKKSTLTKRELEVVILASRGHLNREIANDLDIALRTVKLYKQQAMEKLGLEKTYDLVRLHIEGLL